MFNYVVLGNLLLRDPLPGDSSAQLSAEQKEGLWCLLLKAPVAQVCLCNLSHDLHAPVAPQELCDHCLSDGQLVATLRFPGLKTGAEPWSE